MAKYGAPCGFSRRFEDGIDSLRTKMKISLILSWRTKIWRTQLSHMLKKENHKLPYLLKMKTAFPKLLKTEDLKIPTKLWRKWGPLRVQGAQNMGTKQKLILSFFTLRTCSDKMFLAVSSIRLYMTNSALCPVFDPQMYKFPQTYKTSLKCIKSDHICINRVPTNVWTKLTTID